MKLRRLIAIWAAKLASTVSKLAGKQGASFAGRIARKIDPQILTDLTSQVREKIFVVCGTNGKTTTNNLLCSALESEGKKLVCNHTGANMLDGVVASFVLAAKNNGKLDADYACLEIDEASTLRVFPHFKPDYMVLTNLFRDQLDRYGEIDTTMDMLLRAMKMAPEMTVIVNGDDALSAYLAMESGNPYRTYGISERVFDTQNEKEIREGRFCKKCGAKLEYDFYHYSQIGSYHCPSCGFARPDADFDASKIDMSDGLSFEVESRRITANYRGFYNIYNILAAYSAARTAGLPLTEFDRVLTEFNPQNGRMEQFKIGNTDIILNLAKNPAGFNQNISAVLEDGREKDVIIVINDKAGDGTDISWLWDVDFDRLAEKSVHSITVSGIRGQDMRLRLKYVDIASELTDDVKTAVEARLKDGCGNLYLLVNYTALLPAREVLVQLKEQGGIFMKIRIGHLYPDLLNLYGDRGNIQCMKKRCEWRGIEAKIQEFQITDELSFQDLDLVLLGGGSEREQKIVGEQLKTIQSEFKAYVEDGGSVLAVCGGYELLGDYYDTGDGKIEGLSLIEMHTDHGEQRLISNTVLESERFTTPVVGFENHGGRTFIGDNKPFGRVLTGFGNNGTDGTEGVLYKNIVGTYLHGPLLPKNPQVCDYLLANALERRYGSVTLTPLDDTQELEANRYIVERFVKK